MKVTIFSNSFQNLYNFRLNLIKFFIEKNIKVSLIASDDKYSDFFKKIGCDIFKLKIKKNSISLISDFILLIKLYKILKNNPPDILFLYTIKPNIYGSIISSILYIKYINTVTGLGTLALRGFLSKKLVFFLYKISFLKSNHIFFQNIYDYQYFFNKSISLYSNISIVPGSGVDLNKFFFTNKKFNKKINFIFVGRLIKDKGMMELLNAFNKILFEFSEIYLDIYGEIDPSNAASINKKIIYKFNKIQNINFLGYDDKIENKYKKYDCLVLPSYREGCSKAILEASASGLPVIASNVPGCNNIVLDNVNGYLCDPKSVNSLYNTIVKFIKLDIKNKIEMSLNGKNLIKNHFDEKIVIQEYYLKIKKYEKK